MKTLEKKELKKIQGGFLMNCSSAGFNKTHCWIYYDNGYQCAGDYDWFGNVKRLECSNPDSI